MRIGMGYDSHRFADNRKLVLGGVEIPHSLGLAGHSDADVLIHALCDALLGAAGLDDIGTQFPDTDPVHRDRPSIEFLRAVAAMIEKAGLRTVNVDMTVVTEAPKLRPHVAEIKKNLAEALGIAPQYVGLKAKTNEKMGFIGRGEGMAAMAVALVEPL